MQENKENKFNFVYEKTTAEDREFIIELQIPRVYHGGIVNNIIEWTIDREKGMYLIDNDSPGSLVLDGIDGPKVDNFIYKNAINRISYRHEYKKLKYSLMIESYYVAPELLEEKQYVIDAMRTALITSITAFYGNCELVSDDWNAVEN